MNDFLLESYTAFSNLCRRIKLLKHVTMSRRGWSWRHCCTKSVCAAHQMSLLQFCPISQVQSPSPSQEHPEVQVIVRKLVSMCLIARKKIKTCGPKKKKIQNTPFSFSGGRNSQPRQAGTAVKVHLGVFVIFPAGHSTSELRRLGGAGRWSWKHSWCGS